VLVILVAVLGMPALALRRRYPPGVDVPLSKLVAFDEDVVLDLPCPWCKGPTGDADPVCPCCGHRFG
jgi:hypothetical protein